MYSYVVYLKVARMYAVIPYHWLRDGDTKVLEKFVNKGLNSNQTHICYYSTLVSAEESAAHPPNHQANFPIDFPPIDEGGGLYYCFVLKFKG